MVVCARASQIDHADVEAALGNMRKSGPFHK